MAEQPVRQRIVVPFTGHVIGEGFNSDTVERVGTALKVGRMGEDKIAPGQTAVLKFQMLTRRRTWRKRSISALSSRRGMPSSAVERSSASLKAAP